MESYTRPGHGGQVAIRLALAIITGIWAAVSTESNARADSIATFRDCPVCPEMVALPGGSFSAGDPRVRNAAPPPETPCGMSPPSPSRAPKPPSDNGKPAWPRGACRGGQDDHGWGRGDRPVINVSAADAQDYVAWLSRRTGHVYRLPTEAEWEYAARAGTTTLYPWGETMQKGRANCRGCDGPVVEHAGTTPVASYPPNPFGLFDMHGNLWELTADCWFPDHMPQEPMQRDSCEAHVMRGGGWYYVPAMSASAARARNAAGVWSYVVGFRVARALDDGEGKQ